MNIAKHPLHIRLLFSAGLILATLPNFINNYVAMPDFLHGTLIGLGLGLEITGLMMMKKRKDTAGWV